MVEDRIYVDRGIDAGTAALLNNNNGWNSPLAAMAMMNGGMNGFGGNGWLNNPFIYLIFLAMFGRGFGFGNNGWGEGCCNGCNNPQIQALSEQMSSNQNANLLMDGIKGNAQAVSTLAANLNCDFNTLNTAICNIQNAITNVAGQLGFSAEKVINAVNMGDCNVIQALQNCCCQTQQQIANFRGDMALQMCQQTGTLRDGQRDLGQAITQGFSQVAFQAQQDKCDIIRASQDNTQRIVDTLNNHWSNEQAREIQDLKTALSQREQTDTLTQRMFYARNWGWNWNGNDCGCNSCGCGCGL